MSRATNGHRPYAYQTLMAVDGLPEALSVPTGAGKTLAAVLGWLFRRRFHPDLQVRAATPRWLVYILPMRTLVEQVHDVVGRWLDNLGLEDEVGLYRVMGGEGRIDAGWRRHLESDAIFIGTLDMIISRQLNRGYGESRYIWPIDFGLFNNGCHFVYDEVQLMGAALPTSRQLHGLRPVLGTALPCTATWMSATLDPSRLATVDAPPVISMVELTEEDRRGNLAVRLDAVKTVRKIEVDDPKRHTTTLGHSALSNHRPGSLTLVIANTVERARSVLQAIDSARPDAELVLLHSRFRPGDRAAHT
ncbi:MAG: DEAD/DEAH box helicase, partial [Acidimicrobiia bacterium]